MPRSSALPFAAFALCAVIWGTTFLAIRVGNEGLPPMWAATLRLVLAGFILSAFVLVTRQSFPKGAALKAAFAYGTLNFGIDFALLYWAETIIPSGLAAVIFASAPIITMLLATAMGLETLNAKKVAAGAAAFLGIGVIFWREVAHGLPPLPILAVLVAATASIVGSLLVKRAPRQSAVALNAVGALVGAPICLLASFAMSESRPFPATAAQWGPLLYLVFAGSIGAFVTYAWLLNQWNTSSVSFLGVVAPVIAVIVGAVALHERLAPGSLVGGALVLGATVYVLRGERKAVAPVPGTAQEAAATPLGSD